MAKPDRSGGNVKITGDLSSALPPEEVDISRILGGEPVVVEIDDDKANSSREHLRRTAQSRALFRAIDILFAAPQNSCPYVNKNNVGTIECQPDLVYNERLKKICNFDIYRVPTGKRRPAVIYIHGGGFSAGDKRYRKGVSQFFALKGFTVFTVNYGLAPDYTFPRPLKQLISAANHIYANAGKYGIDKKRIILAGDSAGAYYAAMMAASIGNDRFRKKFGCALDFDALGTISICGLFDMDMVLQSRYIFEVDKGIFHSFTGGSRDEYDKFAYRGCCMPIEFVTESFPPIFLIHTDGDVLCKGQSEKFMARLDELGCYHENYAARHPGTSIHCFSLNWRGEDACAANELMMSFAKRLADGHIKYRRKKRKTNGENKHE